ncbi:MAG: hypothetical protein ACR2QF_17875 [Geminicoccaceae bacterium]
MALPTAFASSLSVNQRIDDLIARIVVRQLFQMLFFCWRCIVGKGSFFDIGSLLGVELMMKTVILICALGMARPDCSTETAITVVQGPDATGLASCGFIGQAYLAETALADYLDGEHYLKILCTAGDRLDARVRPASANQMSAEVID